MTRRIACLALLCLLLAGCAARGPALPQPRLEPVADVETFPQTAWAFVRQADAPLLGPARQETRFAEFRARWFAPWRRAAPSHRAEDVFWGFSAFQGKAWGQELRPRPAAWLEALSRNTRREEYPNLSRPAIALRRLDLRVLPEAAPVFRDPAAQGEGFPFDMNQNSSVQAGTPLFASHVTDDGAWLLVEGPFAAGFVPARDVAFVGPAFAQRWQGLPLGAVVIEGAPLRAADGRTLELGRIGAVLPLSDPDGAPRLLLPVDDGTGHAAEASVTALPGAVTAMPAPATQGALAGLIDQLLGRPYGWGGMYGERDCSALLQDLFTPFGVALPRNSGQQARSGPSVSFKDEAGAPLPDDARLARIRAEGRPFLTLLTMPGHVMLYLGEWQGEPAALHAVWGVRTRGGEAVTPGRLVIGRTVVTSLRPGLEQPDRVPPESLLLRRLAGMTFVE